ncbi:DNA-binding response regulator [Lacihabitans sp. CCS-44]|uniref:LytR/AlgR family response regulator transcription factor n=1 Tax=Lacihabitans sp. CCS-44 TaxID=2487331 RepID=UPI0020CC988B|nr:LytTR family DNA-binding domain-containing protein [Lacihabitans sp. CCS-44]MCP9757214.1 DNA-binding response regulator [Lacihabitans sp. CCS-44]
MNCIAIDDEPLALSLLESNISKVPFLNLKATCGDAFEALKVISTEKIDLIFVDIQMPGLSGLQLIKSLENPPMVILVTAYKQYALDGHDLAVVDYLVKPVALERFIKACTRAKELYDLKTAKSTQSLENKALHFFVNADYSQIKVVFADILWLEGLGDYVKFHLKSTSKPLVVRTTFKNLESELPQDQFIRIHKSLMVSTSQITAIRKNSVFLGEMEFSIGETYRKNLETAF